MRVSKLLLLIVIAGSICACSLVSTIPTPSFLKSDQTANQAPRSKMVNVIAVLPIEGGTVDSKATKMLRTKLCEELRFKGYPQIDTAMIDSKLTPLTAGRTARKNDVIPPKVVEELVGADGVMYCSLVEHKRMNLIYAPVTVSVKCILRSAKTGETIWNAQSQSTSGSFDLLPQRLNMKSRGDLEEAMEEVVDKVMETLPYGPKLRG